MRMTVGTKLLINCLERILLKGKYVSSLGVKNGQLSNYAEIIVVDFQTTPYIEVRNADNSTAVKTIFHTEIQEEGEFIVEIDKMIKYLKTMGETTLIESTDVIKLSSGGKKATLPMVIVHPHSTTIEMLCKTAMEFDATLTEKITFGDKGTEYNTVVQMLVEDFIDGINSCESAGSGIYKFDYNEEFVISSSLGAEKYSQEMECRVVGEPATVDISAPVHKLFMNEKQSIINLYFNDDVPITIMTGSSFLIRAPRVSGN
jgi:hypothetical protein